jgi:hypothetical protein
MILGAVPVLVRSLKRRNGDRAGALDAVIA